MVKGVVQELRQRLDVAGLVVHAGQQRVLEEKLAAGLVHVVAGGVHELGDGVAGGHRHDLLPLVVEGRVQRDRQVELLGLVGEAPYLVYQAARGDGDVPRGEVEPIPVVQDPEGLYGLVVVEHRLAHTHHHDVRDPLGRDVAGGDEDLLGDLARLQVALDPEQPRRAELAGHRAPDLRRDADGVPSPLRDHDRLDGVPVVRVEEVLPGPVRSPGGVAQVERRSGRGLVQGLAQALGQARRLLPVAHEAYRKRGVGLGQAVARFAPRFEGLLYFGQKLGGSHGEMLARWPGALAGPPRLRVPRPRLSCGRW